VVPLRDLKLSDVGYQTDSLRGFDPQMDFLQVLDYLYSEFREEAARSLPPVPLFPLPADQGSLLQSTPASRSPSQC
jgi:hypothetical protein